MNHDHSSHSDMQAEKTITVPDPHEGHHHTMPSPVQGHDGHAHAGHDHSAMIEDFLRRFWVCLILTIPVVVFSPMFQHIAGYSFDFEGRNWVSMGLATVIFIYGGKPFLTGMVEELRSGDVGMMTLIAVAISTAYAYSTAVALGFLTGMDFYWELATFIVIMLLGHWIEMKSVAGASRALELMVKMLPAEAHHLMDGKVHDMRVDMLKVGHIVLVKSGEKIPVDGTILEGESFVNESLLTGESVPLHKSKGMKVIAGGINSEGVLTIQVDREGKDSYLNKVIALVKEAQDAKSQTQNLANRAAKWLTFISLGVGFLTLFVWLSKGMGLAFALERMVTVMVTACPHALGVAIPLVVAISTTISARKGLLIRNRTAFEDARKITAIVFDKTGTLTEGSFGVMGIESLDATLNKDQFLSIVAALEQQSEHPIAKGVVRATQDQNLTLPKVEQVTSMTGKGISGKVGADNWQITSPSYLKTIGIDIPQSAAERKAETVIFALKNNKLVGFIALADKIRVDAADTVQKLKSQNIKVFMATGDNNQVAQYIADKLNLDGFFAEVLPHQKVEIVKDLQAKGEFVAMTGDGVNDAPALAQANIGIAVGSGTDVAAETADIILTDSRPSDVLNLIQFGKATYSKMIQNLFWATGYNLFAIPLAAGVLYPNFVLSPAMGAVLMSVSTVIVAFNAQLLRRSIV
jgi:P-type Cu2+ transporter